MASKEHNARYRSKNRDKLNANARHRYHSDPEYRKKVTESGKRWQSKNRDRIRSYGQKHDRLRRIKGIEKRLLNAAKTRARVKNLQFSIDLSDIVIPDTCPYLGIKITRIFDRGRTKSNPSLDRIDNSKGYVKGNVRVISNQANAMKRDASIEELILFAENILKLHAGSFGTI